MSGNKAEEIKAYQKLFVKGWSVESGKLSALTSAAWHNEKKLAGVKSAKWFQKSNNIGPKLDKLQTARAKFDKQVNNNNYMAVFNALVDLEKAFDAFRKNRDGATPEQTKSINATIDGYEKITDPVKKWLAGQEKTVALLDKAEGMGMIDQIVI